VLGALLAFGLLVAASGLMLASVPVTLQGVGVAALGLLGLVLTAGRLPRRLPWAVPVGALVLLATAVENARSGLSAWAPLGLLTGAALLSMPIRALPPAQKPGAAAPSAAPSAARLGGREPSAAVVLVVIGLVLMIGYEALSHLLAPDARDLPSYAAAVGMPFAAAIAAGALAVLAARRGGAAGLAAGGALVLVSAGLYMTQAAGDAWWLRRSGIATGVGMSIGADSGNTAVPILAQTIDTDNSLVAVAYGNVGSEFAATTLVVVGLVLTVAGWWWAAVRRPAG
jgi:hypothetical protein